MEPSQVKLKKQPQKYLAKVDSITYKKLRKALDGLENWEGDIIRLKDSEFYRLKIPQYRIIFTHQYDDEINIIWVEEINTRTNINYGRYSQ
ncbi:MAG: addiction module toxin RelE [Clostridiales bacterium]|nr:addiction module toxin RelE [Clostridiales bacterium]